MLSTLSVLVSEDPGAVSNPALIQLFADTITSLIGAYIHSAQAVKIWFYVGVQDRLHICMGLMSAGSCVRMCGLSTAEQSRDAIRKTTVLSVCQSICCPLSSSPSFSVNCVLLPASLFSGEMGL